MANQQSAELERLVRSMVKAVAEFSNRNMQVLEEELAEKIGISHRTFQNYYRSRGRISDKAIRVLLECAGGCPYLSRAWGQHLLTLTGYDRYDDLVILLDMYWPPDPNRSRPSIRLTVSLNS